MRHQIRLPNEVKIWYVVNCLQCAVTIPFESEETRRLWMYDHESETQHAFKSWLELDFETEGPLWPPYGE